MTSRDANIFQLLIITLFLLEYTALVSVTFWRNFIFSYPYDRVKFCLLVKDIMYNSGVNWSIEYRVLLVPLFLNK